MDQCKIIDYDENWREKLFNYMKYTFPNYTEAYINYCLDCSTDRIPSKMVVNQEGEIVGCHLYFCTKALVNGKEIDTQWGHDTYLNEAYRKEMGLDLMLLTQSIKGFGLGITEINEKIQKKLKNVFFDGVFNYYLINWWVLISPFQKYFSSFHKIDARESICVEGIQFKLVKNIEEISIPNNGYWMNGHRDIEFIRDGEFLSKRFILNKVKSYYVYTLETPNDKCYFVVRLTYYRGMPTLTLCDYRYYNDNEKMLSLIIKAVKKIATKSHLGIIVFLCGDINMKKALEGSLYHKTPVAFLTNRKDRADMSYIITGGDSDADFYKY